MITLGTMKKNLLRLSVPVKVLFFAGAAYAAVWCLRLLVVLFGADLTQTFLGFELHIWFGIASLLAVAIATTSGSYFFFDRPVRQLFETIRLEKGESSDSFSAEEEFTELHRELQSLLQHKEHVLSHTNAHLENVIKDMAMLYAIGQQVNSVVDLDDLYTMITQTLKQSLEIEEFAVMVFDEKKEELHVRAAYGFTDDEAVLRTIFHEDEGISGLAAKSGRKIYIRDTREETRFLHYKGKQLSRSLSFLSLPLIYKKNVLGVINFGRAQTSAFTAADVKMLSLVANQVALALANAQLYTKTRELSIKDELTGLANRRYFQQMIQVEWKRAVRFRRDLSVLMIDVDYFKKYNDTHGHLEGDKLLRALGAVFRNNLREVDTAARFGGEEFILLLPDTDKRGAIVVGEKMRRLIEEQSRGDRTLFQGSISISVGIATFPDDVAEIDDLIDHADIALYRAKEEGRNRVVCYALPKPTIASEAEPVISPSGEKREKKKFLSTIQ
ncbi:MAG: hypothetical protein A3I05_06995 [Deltaproteobacteria bacterium RIFCSPLOWO2_02_FULL_44_10]|nr:MAG: hypothetical protein A3C46_00370 [Deltaproteobacteria bacterium RIFCSPHIGHO2_02_FULL_44_16]OGQ45470.1 MAG: hypothetical protein A3I05_06995 [Deltaproteobacteria bacterium RIFCSPLOWO2_02_FULL_44_10]